MAWVTLTTSAIPTHWPAFLVSRAVAHVQPLNQLSLLGLHSCRSAVSTAARNKVRISAVIKENTLKSHF